MNTQTNKDAKFVGTIDCTPSWVSLVDPLVEIANSVDHKAKPLARQELLKMARAADAYVAILKDKSLQPTIQY